MHRSFLVCTAVFLAGVTLSCGPRARISGEVLDGFGAPVSGVAITAVVGGAQRRATTDTQGRYTVGSAAGKVALRCEKEGYTASSFEVDLAQGAEVSAPKTVLYEIPKGEGIWLVGKDPWGKWSYERLKPTKVQVQFAFRMGQAGLKANTTALLADRGPALPDTPTQRFIDTLPSRTVLINVPVFFGQQESDRGTGALRIASPKILKTCARQIHPGVWLREVNLSTAGIWAFVSPETAKTASPLSDNGPIHAFHRDFPSGRSSMPVAGVCQDRE